MVMPYLVKALIGDSGIIAFFILLFMALTSTVSSSMIAVSSILSFDLYKTYFNPKATDKRLLHVSHLSVVFHAVFITGISIALNYGGANMTWIGYFRPILSCPGIIPLALTLFWSGQTRLAAILSPVLGFFTGLAIWLASAKSLYGTVDMTTTGEGLPALYGAIGSFFSPALYSVIISLYKPHQFDWRVFLRIELADEAQLHAADQSPKEAHSGSKAVDESTPASETASTGDPERVSVANEKSMIVSSTPAMTLPAQLSLDDIRHPFSDETLKELHRWSRIAWVVFVVLVLITFILWPMPLYRNYIFTKSFFSGWVTVAIIWQFLAFVAVVVYPLYDGRFEIAKGVSGIWNTARRYLTKKRS
jgi:Na+/proline symporter